MASHFDYAHFNPRELNRLDQAQGGRTHVPGTKIRHYKRLESMLQDPHMKEKFIAHCRENHKEGHSVGRMVEHANHMRQAGRNGDSEIALIGPHTKETLHCMMAGGGSINPMTGKHEFFGWDDIGNGFKDAGSWAAKNLGSHAGAALGHHFGGEKGAALGHTLGGLAGKIGGEALGGDNNSAVSRALTGAGNQFGVNPYAIEGGTAGGVHQVGRDIQGFGGKYADNAGKALSGAAGAFMNTPAGHQAVGGGGQAPAQQNMAQNAAAANPGMPPVPAQQQQPMAQRRSPWGQAAKAVTAQRPVGLNAFGA